MYQKRGHGDNPNSDGHFGPLPEGEKLKYEMMSKVAILSLYAHILMAQMTNEFLIYIAYLSSIIYSSTYLNVEI